MLSMFDPIDTKRASWWEKNLREGNVSHPMVDAINELKPGETHTFLEKELMPAVHDMICAARIVHNWYGYVFTRDDYDMTVKVTRPSLAAD